MLNTISMTTTATITVHLWVSLFPGTVLSTLYSMSFILAMTCEVTSYYNSLFTGEVIEAQSI